MRRLLFALIVLAFASSVMAQDITDTFNRANSSSSLGNTDTGQTWSALGGTWGIVSNTGYVATTGGDSDIAVVESGVADTTITVTLATNGGDAGIGFRVADSSNFYIANMQGGGVHLYKYVAAAYTELVVAGQAAADGDVLAVVLSGTSIIIKVNGVAKITTTDSTFTTQTKHGIWAYTADGGTRFDTFSITRPAAATGRRTLTMLGVGPQ